MKTSYMIGLILAVVIAASLPTPPTAAATAYPMEDEKGYPNILSTVYSLKEIWSINMTNTYSSSINVYYDLDNDGLKELIVYGEEVDTAPASEVIVLSGNSTIISRLELSGEGPFSSYPAVIDIVDDADGDGYPELVLYFYSIDVLSNKTQIGFLTWQPVGDKVIANATYTFDQIIPSMTTPGIVVEGDTASTVISTIESSTGGIPTFKSYWFHYNVLTGNLTMDVESNTLYEIYTDQLIGDVDGDGVVELTHEYIVEASTVFALFPSPGLYSTVKTYTGGQLLFSKQLPANYIPILVSPNSVGAETIYDIACIMYDLASNKTYTHIVAVSQTGSTIYDLSLGEQTLPLNGVFIGEYILVNYININENKTYLALIDNSNGEILASKPNIYISQIEPLGDIDGDGEIEAVYKNISINYRVLHIPSLTWDIIAGSANISSIADYTAYELENTTAIPLISDTPSGSIIGLYSLVRGEINDTTPPVINVFYPVNNTLVGRKTTLYASVTDPESGVSGINATLYDEETGSSKRLEYSYDPLTGILKSEIVFNHSGSYRVTISAENNAGLSSSETIIFEVDAEPPQIQILYPENNTVITPIDLPLNISFTVSDEHDVLWAVLVNGEYAGGGAGRGTYTVSINSSLVKPGLNNITVKAVDEAFNPSGETVFVKYVMTPMVNVSIMNEEVLEGYLSGVVEVSIVFKGYLPGTGYMFNVSIDGEAIYGSMLNLSQTYNVSIDTRLYSDGEHLFEVFMTYPNGTIEILYSRTIRIDNNPPQIHYEIPYIEGNIVNSMNALAVIDGKAVIEVKIDVDDTYLAWIAIIVDGEVVSNHTVSETIHILSKPIILLGDELVEENLTLDEGRHNITITSADKAGHVSSTSTTLLVDVSPPEITEFSVEPGQLEATVSWNIRDNVSGVANITILVDGEPVKTIKVDSTTSTDTVKITGLEPGRHNITIEAVDNAGNKALMTETVSIKASTTTTTTTSTTSTSTETTTPTQTTTSTATTTTPTTTHTTTTETTTTTTGAKGERLGGASTTIIIAVVIAALIGLGVFYMLRRKP